MKTKTQWLLVLATVAAAAVIITLVALFAPRGEADLRLGLTPVGDTGRYGSSESTCWVTWAVPDGGAVWNHIWRSTFDDVHSGKPTTVWLIGPVQRELWARSGEVWWELGAEYPLRGNPPEGLKLDYTWMYPMDRNYLGSPQAYVRPRRGDPEQVFRVRIMVAGKYVFEWDSPGEDAPEGP
ncbi:MAG TPA: hypothetical protein VMY35_03120 [Phycisphaerae bacterium]|nr:hypothetical protein [Phycisphaerae bacterium]